MAKISIHTRRLLVRSNLRLSQIAAHTGHSKNGLEKARRRIHETLSLFNRTRPLTIPDDREAMDVIMELLRNRSDTPRRVFTRELANRNIIRSRKQVSRRLPFAGRKYGRKQMCQTISVESRQSRLLYRQLVMDQRELFYNHIFVDESMILLRGTSKFEWVPLRTHATKSMKASHSPGIIIFGGISRRGPTPFLISASTARNTSMSYCDIVSRTVYPFIRDHYNNNAFIVQDNAPIHVSAYTQDFFHRLGLRTTYHPPHSPDFNPIEYVWRSLKEYVRERRVTTIAQLKNVVAEYVRTQLTVRFCNTLIEQARINIFRSIDGLNWEGREPTAVLYA